MITVIIVAAIAYVGGVITSDKVKEKYIQLKTKLTGK